MITRHIFRLWIVILCFLGNSKLLAQTFPNPATLSTGQGAQGSLDPLWLVSPWFYENPPNPLSTTYSSALINGNCAPGSWIDPTTLPPPVNNGNWITGADAPCATDTSSGYRYFRLTLNLPADCNGNSVTTPGIYVLNLTGYVDNLISNVYVNGTPTGISGGGYSAGSQLNITLNGPWVPGINYVDILIYNGHEFPPVANPYGLLMVANSSHPSFYCSPYPAPNECNTNLIRNTLVAAGNTELQGMDNTCSLYFINPQYMDGPAAQAYAQTFGANLISVQSAAENTALTSALNNQGYAGDVIWIGFTRTFPGGPFVWTDSSAISYTNWSAGEPNNSGGVESCTQIYPGGQWNDLNCFGYNSLSVIEVNLCPVTTIRVSEDTLCVGQSATLVASTLLGASPYTYTWTSVPAGFTSTSATIIPSPSVTTVYNVTSVDRYGCTSTASYTIYVDSYTVTPSQTNLLCYGLNNGSATATVTGGLTPFTYVWSNGNTTPTSTNLTTGLYTVSINDGSNCPTTQLFTITGPNVSPLSVVGPVNPYCDTTKLDWVTWSSVTATSGVGAVSSNIGVTLTKPTGGLATTPSLFSSGNFPSQYNLPNNATTLENTLAGVFTFCFSRPVVDPQVAFASIGQLSISVPIITSVPYTVIWPGTGMTYPNNTTLVGAEGFTIIQFPGQHTCISFNYLVSENYCNLVFGIRDTNCQTTPICRGVPATFTASGAVTYTWSPATGLNTTNGSVVTANPSSYQTYTIVATDASGCTDTAITSITVNNPPVVTVSSFTNVSCFGGNNGAIETNVTSGTTPYTYAWNNAATSPNINTLTQGNYSVVVTDANSCMDTAYQQITQPNILKDSISDFSNLSCFGIPNGSATVGVRGGTTPYNYSWSSTPAQNTATANTLPAGDYTVTVTDVNLCSTTATVTLTQPPALTLTAMQSNVTCFGLSTGSATATATGGTSPYTYAWSTIPPQVSLTGIGTGMAAGSYTAGVQDFNGCQDTVSITITQPALLVDSILSSKNDSCFGTHNGNALTGISGGTTPYTYSWNTTPVQTTQNAYNLPTGTYTSTTTDAHGCTDTTVVSITQPALLVASISSFKNDSCFGTHNGNAATGVVGGTTPYSYSWNTSPAQATDTAINLPFGTYTVTVIDAQGCLATTTVSINQPPALTLTTSQTNVSCNGLSDGSATVAASGGTTPYGYVWSTLPPQISLTGIGTGMLAGSYTAGVQDANGCEDTISITITQPAVLAASISTFTNVSCFGLHDGSATGAATGGTIPYSYLWSNGEVSLKDSLLAAGAYTFTVTDAHACTDTISITITQPNLLQDSVITFVNDSCHGDSNGSSTAIFVGGTRPYNFQWLPSGGIDSTANNLPAGIYAVTNTDAHGCIATATVTISEAPILTISSTATLICISNTAVLTATANGGNTAQSYTYSFNGTSNNTVSVNPSKTTTYTMQVTDMKGCKDTNHVIVHVRDSLKFIAVSPGTEKCPGFSSNINATGSGGDSTFTYTWNPGNIVSQNTTVTPSVTTVYTVTLSDACGTPTVNAFVNVLIDTLPQINFTATPTSGCYPLCVQFSNNTSISSSDAITYSWTLNNTTNSTATNPYFCYNKVGTYAVSLTATSSKGCVSTNVVPNMITVYNHPKAEYDYSPDTITIMNPTVQFRSTSYAPGSSIANVYWKTFGDGGDTTSILPMVNHTYQDTGTYCPMLVVTNSVGCKDSVSKCLVVQSYFTLYIPNAFTPNGDSHDEIFNAIGDFISSFDMRIFDRWGNQIYHTTNVNEGWNGMKNGNGAVLQPDVYVYVINATDPNNKPYSYKGTVTLIR